MFVPDANFPVALFPAGQRLSLIFDIHRLVGKDLATVPFVADVGLELFDARCNQNVICRLQLGPLFRFKQPAEARSGRIDTQRVGRVLAGQFRSCQRRVLFGAICRRVQQDGYGKAQRQADSAESHLSPQLNAREWRE